MSTALIETMSLFKALQFQINIQFQNRTFLLINHISPEQKFSVSTAYIALSIYGLCLVNYFMVSHNNNRKQKMKSEIVAAAVLPQRKIKAKNCHDKKHLHVGSHVLIWY